MSSAVDIQIVSQANLDKIEEFFKDASYRETIEFSANFNTRLCIERRLRLPFFDAQTGVAQNSSHLYADRRQRMPGFRQGQIYTYPAARWRKSRRQYLNKVYRFPDRPFQALRKEHEALLLTASGGGGGMGGVAVTHSIGTASPTTSSVLHHDPDFNGALLEESSSLGAAGGDTSDSKDSQQQQQQQQQQQHQQQQAHQQHQELPKEWFYDDMDLNDVDSPEEPKSPADDEYDYDPRYGSKKRRKRRYGKRGLQLGDGPLGPGSGMGGGSGGVSGAGRRRSGMGRGRATAVSSPADSSFSMLDSTLDSFSGDLLSTPTTSSAGGGRRARGTGTRGRRRSNKGTAATCGVGSPVPGHAGACDPPSPGLTSEPPSFESAAAAVGDMAALGGVVVDEHGDLRNYRKYL